MIALDTNILARAIVVEAAADSATRTQQQRARKLLSSARTVRPVDGSTGTRMGVAQRLRHADRRYASLFDDLLAVENIEVDRAAAVAQAVEWYRSGLDFSDALHLAQVGLCESLATFDAGFARRARRLHLKPPVSAPA